jgi:hypothetical protein
MATDAQRREISGVLYDVLTGEYPNASLGEIADLIINVLEYTEPEPEQVHVVNVGNGRWIEKGETIRGLFE